MVVCTFFGGMFPLPQNPFENFNPAKHYGAKAPELQNPQRRPPRKAGATKPRRHQPSFSTLAKSSSTGVERPKIVTETFKRLWSLSISSTVPLKLANG